MKVEALADRPWEKDPAQGLVRIDTVRANDFAYAGVHFGWIDGAEDDWGVSLILCENQLGDEGDYVLHLNPAHIVSWRYADLTEVPTR